MTGENQNEVVLHNTPVHYSNHIHLMKTHEGNFIEFRAIAPSVFGPASSGKIDVNMVNIPPFVKIFMTNKGLSELYRALQELHEVEAFPESPQVKESQ